MHSLKPLNTVTIAHSPTMEKLAVHFSGCACGGIFDLYVGYDERALAEESRDMMTYARYF